MTVINPRFFDPLKTRRLHGVRRFASSGIQKKNVIMLKEFND